MNPIPATFEVHQDGQKPRLFRFTEPEISFGFSTRCNVSLEPHSEMGAELALVTRDDPCILRIKNGPGAFSLNGTPCVADAAVGSGDIIKIGSYTITIRSLPKTTPADRPSPAEPAAEPLTSLGNAAAPERAKAAGTPEERATNPAPPPGRNR